MPTYGGGKCRLGKEIYEIIKKIEKKYNFQGDYFEPFCGLLGVGIHFAKENRKVIACDANKNLILMWNKLKKGWNLPEEGCTKIEYDKLRQSKSSSAKKGFFGIACAYSGIFFAGYRLDDSKGNNFFKRTRDGINKMVPYLKNIDFLSGASYDSFVPKGLTIYCDPPYKNNKFNCQYFNDFDHEKFWNIMREWSKDNLVLISEYSAPKDFKVIWMKEMKTTYRNQSKNRIEKIFIFEDSYIRR